MPELATVSFLESLRAALAELLGVPAPDQPSVEQPCGLWCFGADEAFATPVYTVLTPYPGDPLEAYRPVTQAIQAMTTAPDMPSAMERAEAIANALQAGGAGAGGAGAEGSGPKMPRINWSIGTPPAWLVLRVVDLRQPMPLGLNQKKLAEVSLNFAVSYVAIPPVEEPPPDPQDP